LIDETEIEAIPRDINSLRIGSAGGCIVVYTVHWGCRHNRHDGVAGGKPASLDARTLDKLYDGVNDTYDDKHMWLAPFTIGEPNTVFIIFDYPVTLSMVKVLWRAAAWLVSA
jgi:hypothetical protein